MFLDGVKWLYFLRTVRTSHDRNNLEMKVPNIFSIMARSANSYRVLGGEETSYRTIVCLATRITSHSLRQISHPTLTPPGVLLLIKKRLAARGSGSQTRRLVTLHNRKMVRNNKPGQKPWHSFTGWFPALVITWSKMCPFLCVESFTYCLRPNTSSISRKRAAAWSLGLSRN